MIKKMTGFKENVEYGSTGITFPLMQGELIKWLMSYAYRINKKNLYQKE